MEVYAYQAKDAELVANATELRKWATRCIGELMQADREAGRMAKAGRPGNRGIENPNFPSLAEQGVDKNLAKEARKLAAMPEDQFEATARSPKGQAAAADAGARKATAQDRLERLKKGESLPGGLGKPMTREGFVQSLRDAGWTTADTNRRAFHAAGLLSDCSKRGFARTGSRCPIPADPGGWIAGICSIQAFSLGLDGAKSAFRAAWVPAPWSGAPGRAGQSPLSPEKADQKCSS